MLTDVKVGKKVIINYNKADKSMVYDNCGRDNKSCTLKHVFIKYMKFGYQ